MRRIPKTITDFRLKVSREPPDIYYIYIYIHIYIYIYISISISLLHDDVNESGLLSNNSHGLPFLGQKERRMNRGGLMTTSSGWGSPRPHLQVSMVSLKGVMSETVAEMAKACQEGFLHLSGFSGFPVN